MNSYSNYRNSDRIESLKNKLNASNIIKKDLLEPNRPQKAPFVRTRFDNEPYQSRIYGG